MHALKTHNFARNICWADQGPPPLTPLPRRSSRRRCGALARPSSTAASPSPPTLSERHAASSSPIHPVLDPKQTQQQQQLSPRPSQHGPSHHPSRIPTSGDATPTTTPTTSPGRNPKPAPGPGPGPGPDGDPDGGGGGLPFRIRYWILLLAEYGGIYGTAAVLIAALTHVDAFGGLHWDAGHVALGLGLMAPAMAFDAVVGLPDWGTKQEDAAAVVRLFVDPDLLQKKQSPPGQLQQQQGQQQGQQPEQGQQAAGAAAAAAAAGAAAASGAGKVEVDAAAAAAAAAGIAPAAAVSAVDADAVPAAAAAAASTSDGERGAEGGGDADSVSIFSSSGRAGAASASATATAGGGAAAASATTTSGPGSEWAARSTAAVAAAAVEVPASDTGSPGGGGGGGGTKSGVGGLWAAAQRLRMAMELMQESSIRNNPGARLEPVQEAAVILVAVIADEMLYRAVLLTLFGRWLRDRAFEAGAEEVFTLPGVLGGTPVDTAAAAQWAALGVGLALGAAVFTAKAWQETRVAERLRAMQEAQAEEAAKALRKQRLMGQHVTEEQLREEREKQARLQAAQASLVASIGVQGALVWLLEGGREVYQLAAAGSSFLLTGNLAAPLAGSLASQLLVSAYQRLGLQRTMQRRAQVVEARRKAALQQRQQTEAEAAAAPTAATAQERPAEAVGAAGEGQEEAEWRAAGADGVAEVKEAAAEAAPAAAAPDAETRERQEQQQQGQQQGQQHQ